ncbi:hypothetical protein [Carboxylicivirga caseinilyticus]|uniref:hypothetical protein n=1 Tax=Carboxylicivirga caseinilyticus TaxID=3417572 RepID=UPI003D34FE71|nr:hypothetical protein [Marinilabiliaceae bacterium A049]
MVNERKCFCKGVSDKDFIYDIFSDKGFVMNAGNFFNSDKNLYSDQETNNNQTEKGNEEANNSCH